MTRKIASIATNDPDNDPTPRVRLRREWIRNRSGRGYCWVVDHTEHRGEIIASGRTAEEADAELRWVYSSPQWDLQFGTFG